MGPLILTLNLGSSSLKWAVYQNRKECARGKLDHYERKNFLTGLEFSNFDAIGYRIVHGGPKFCKPLLLTKKVVKEIASFADFAPLHLPKTLDMISDMQRYFPKAVHVGCFDTYFHRTIPKIHKILPLNTACYEEGICLYGFHGLSCEYVSKKIKGRAIIAHLGGGSSLTAIVDGKSVDTTMSFSPTGGVMMNTRPGDLDPELILFLLKRFNGNIKKLRHFLNTECGLLGISGLSSKMDVLLASKNKQTKMAIDKYCERIAMQIGAFAAILGKLDTLIFTGGIGESCPSIRKKIVDKLVFLKNRPSISVIKDNEELIIASHTSSLYFAKGHYEG